MPKAKYRQLRTSKANDVLGTIKRCFAYISINYHAQFIIAIIFIFLSAFASVVSSYLFTPIINDYVVPYIGSANPDLSGFLKMVIIMAIIYLIGTISSYIYQRLISIVSTGVLDNMRKDLFNKMEKLPVRFFDKRTHGEIMNHYTNDIDLVRPMIADGFPTLCITSVTIVTCFAFMFYLNVKLTLIVLLTFILMFAFTLTMAKLSRKTFADLQVAVSNINGYTQEMFSGQKVIKVFTHEKQARESFKVLNDIQYKAAVKTNIFSSVLMPVNANISYIAYAVVAVMGSKMLIEGTMTLGAITSFLLYVRQFAGPISNLSQQFNGIMMSLAGAERVFNILDKDDELDEGSITLVKTKLVDDKLYEDNKGDIWAWKLPLVEAKYIKLEGDVRLNNVTFAYDENKTILKDISLYAKPGQKIAFVGSTGAGKTTITNLLNRFYDVKDELGNITFDGIPLKEIKKDDLRKSIGMVLQDTNLFKGTVMDNIRYGNLNASDEQCKEAAKRCNADSFISRLPKGYDTLLSSNGSNLSQGQRQLLNIARCAVNDPPVMILDEATSSIDTHTEKLIEKGMDELMKGRTTFVIAHRLSTVRNADAIIVLEGGQIIERGNHQQLIEQKGRYYQLYTGKAELD